MSGYQAADSPSRHAARTTRSALARHPLSYERRALDSTLRREVSEPTEAVPAVPDLPLPILVVVSDGTFQGVLKTLPEDLPTCGELGLSECFIDGTFITRKK